MVEFKAFDVERVCDFVGGHETLRGIVGEGPITASEIGDGNLNLAFAIKSDQSAHPTLLLKQALPYLRVAGEGWPLTRDRMRFETESLLFHNKVAAGLVPKVFAHDLDNSWVAMEFLADHDVLRHAIKAAVPLRNAAREIGVFSARLTYHSSEMSLTAQEKRTRVQAFTNPDLCNLQEQFVFTNPFFGSEENRWIDEIDADVQAVRQDPTLKRAIAHAKAVYMGTSQALLHGDLHTGSVMVNRSGGDAQTRIIDPEFAFYGPVAYDLGTLFANFAINALAQSVLGENLQAREELQAELVAGIDAAWHGFVSEIETLWTLQASGDLANPAYWDGDETGFKTFRSEYLQSIAAQCGAQGGCELLRRCMGIVSVSELEAIDDLRDRARVERQIIAIARDWLLTPAPDTADLGQAVAHLTTSVADAVSNMKRNP